MPTHTMRPPFQQGDTFISAAERYVPDMSRSIALPCMVDASFRTLRAASRQAASTLDAIGRLLNPEAARMNLYAWVV